MPNSRLISAVIVPKPHKILKFIRTTIPISELFEWLLQKGFSDLMLPSKYQTLRGTCTMEAVWLKNAPSTLQLLTQTINSQPEGMPGFSFQKFVPLNRYAWVGNVIFHKAVWYHAQEQLTVGSPTPLHKLHLWEQKGADLEIHIDRQKNIMSIDFL